MSTQIYSNAEVYFNGTKLVEAASVKLGRDSKASMVETISRGFAGMTPGAKMMTISIDNAVPSADFELDPGTFIGELTPGTITVFVAGRSLSSKGFIVNDSFQYSTNSSSQLSFEFMGEFAKWV